MKLYILYDEYKKNGVDASLVKVPQSSGSSNSEVGEPKFKGGGARKALKMNPNVLVVSNLFFL